MSLFMRFLGMLPDEPPCPDCGFDCPYCQACPHCGSRRDPIIKPADELFRERRGCLDCDRWWNSVELKS